MNYLKQCLATLVILALLLIIYELLLTPNVPTITAQQGNTAYQHVGTYGMTDALYQHMSLSTLNKTHQEVDNNPGKCVLRELLQDDEIIQ